MDPKPTTDKSTIIETLKQSRSAIMGFSILWIVINHLAFFNIISTPVLNSFLQIGSCGVDIFLFLSSFGLYFGYKKYKSDIQFYLKRLNRITPPIIICYLISCAIKRCPLISVVTGLRSYIYCMWFILCIIIFYSIFPILYTYIFKSADKQQQNSKSLFLVSLFLTLLLFVVLRDFGFGYMYSTFMNTEQRFLIFISGLLFISGFKFIEYIYSSHWCFFASLISAFCIHYFNGIFFNFIFVVYFFLAISCLKYLVYIFQKNNKLKKIFSSIGTISLEWYLLHMTVMPVLPINMPFTIKILAGVVGTFMTAYLVHFLLEKTYYKYIKLYK